MHDPPANSHAHPPPPPHLVGLARFHAPWPESPSADSLAPPSAVEPAETAVAQVAGAVAMLDLHDGTFAVLTGQIPAAVTPPDAVILRLLTIRPEFEESPDGPVHRRNRIESAVELADPDGQIEFAIVNHFSPRRVLTAADFSPKAFRQVSDGTFWIGETSGPFLLHVDAAGTVLEPPVSLPDFAHPGEELRSPKNPFALQASPVRVMRAIRGHARHHGNRKSVGCSPWHILVHDPAALADDIGPVDNRIFDVKALREAGFAVVVWTVNDAPRMRQMLAAGVDGIITDRPDVLQAVLREWPAESGILSPDGLIDSTRFQAHGHRGARDLRPENTLPAMEVALDFLMTALETDLGLCADGVPMLNHDPFVEAKKFRRADGKAYTADDEVLMADLTAAELQATFVADGLIRETQRREAELSPVAQAFAEMTGLPSLYVPPSLPQLFAFVAFYTAFYRSGAGRDHPEAARRADNAARVWFNLETKTNPLSQAAHRTADAAALGCAVAEIIMAHGMHGRAQVQSFDFRALVAIHERFGTIRTACLFTDTGDFGDAPRPHPPTDGTETATPVPRGQRSPWLAGLFWPYRDTGNRPTRCAPTAGLHGLALSPDGTRLLPLLDFQPAAGSGAEPATAGRELAMAEFDLAERCFTGRFHRVPLDPATTSIGDFIVLDTHTGLIIERAESAENLGETSSRRLVKLRFGNLGEAVTKRDVADLQQLLPFPLLAPTRASTAGPVWAVEGLARLDPVRFSDSSALAPPRLPWYRRDDLPAPSSADERLAWVDTEFLLLELPAE